MPNVLKKDALDKVAFKEYQSARRQKALHIKYRDEEVPEETKIIEKKADRMIVEAIPGLIHLILTILLVAGTVIGVAALLFEPSRQELLYQWNEVIQQIKGMLGI